MMSYKDFAAELELCRAEIERLVDATSMHADPGFRKWRLRLTELLTEIRRQRYRVGCNVTSRSFGSYDPYDTSDPGHHELLASYRRDLFDTANELDLVIDNFKKYGEPHRQLASGKKEPELVVPQKEFEKVTLLWLVHYLPLKLWISACGIAFVIFVAGVQIGQISLVQEFLGKPSLSQATSIEPSVLQDRIDRLTEGYNKNVVQITTQILSEEQAAGRTVYSLEQQPHIDAANRLRALLENEHKKYREAISELHGLQKPK